jgi:hypothetical protein
VNIPGTPGGARRDRTLIQSLLGWSDDDLILTIGAAAIILGNRWRMTEGDVMARLTELAKLQDAAERDAARQAMTS